ncbi:uncharacterized protein LAESUDRAFT_759876 [Laetiporus sulphureus 93-53]|uniref:Uncharacterized protein n=1 Tax=Laetiporus sulphureus 93-53 TaxID=1314785 RepID=A0A165E068_9APHY|nr:uncharacterized protein LAESUDRAFT_759876 [Laetiporus sulphureus 93-53]KZT05993.1 hypothetical protein LAESUDRAFT_759876 [Laetiporus sulphureus 93-53]
MPRKLRTQVEEVFRLDSLLPEEWLHRPFYNVQPSSFRPFIRSAHKRTPELFSSDVSATDEDGKRLLNQVLTVITASLKLQKLESSDRPRKEHDYIHNVYFFRSLAMTMSDHLSQCSISLPQPLKPITDDSLHYLNAKTALPDTSVFIPAHRLNELHQESTSPYRVLQGHPSIMGPGNGGETDFRFQATPCTELSSPLKFQFASSFWEDKRDTQSPGHAYRQNIMSTTAALRQLHAFDIDLPVFGLIWQQGEVTAHVDWWEHGEDEQHPVIRSAAYPGPDGHPVGSGGRFHRWVLKEPSDMLQVFLLVRNIDLWTVGTFRELIIEGIENLVESAMHDGKKIRPWRRSSVKVARSSEGDQKRQRSDAVASNSSPTPKRRRKLC